MRRPSVIFLFMMYCIIFHSLHLKTTSSADLSMPKQIYSSVVSSLYHHPFRQLPCYLVFRRYPKNWDVELPQRWGEKGTMKIRKWIKKREYTHGNTVRGLTPSTLYVQRRVSPAKELHALDFQNSCLGGIS